MNIGAFETKGRVFLAPMAGVTDLSYREIAVSCGAALAAGEMVSAKALTMRNPKTYELLETSGADRPSAVQLFGREPSVMAEAACILNETAFEIIDINMGCPVKKIVRNGEGSALMRDAALAGRIVAAVVRAAKKPVTVKIRKGIDGLNNAVEIAKACEENGAAAVCVHGRTAEQLYGGKADRLIIKAVKDAVKIPVIGNGDIDTIESAMDMFDVTDCDAVSIGRAAHGNPWIFGRVSAYIESGAAPAEPAAKERIGQAVSHINMLCERKGEYIGLREARGHLCAYIKAIPGAAKARRKINEAETIADMTAALYALVN